MANGGQDFDPELLRRMAGEVWERIWGSRRIALAIVGTVIALFVLPLITMRTYSEEKRSGTIELLLTSPLTDFEIIMGKFLGAVALYSLMLGVTIIHIGILFVYGNPEWKPIATGYLGLLLMGASFISVGLWISSLTRNQATEDDVTIPSGPFADGTTMHASYMRLSLDDWYGQLSENERVARMYAPQVTLRQVTDDFTTDAESDPSLLGQAISRYGVIGHSQTSARARRRWRLRAPPPAALTRSTSTAAARVTDQPGLRRTHRQACSRHKVRRARIGRSARKRRRSSANSAALE